MDDASLNKHYELLCMIVNHGQAGKVMKIAKQQGITGCTVFLGYGTIKNRILEFLEINDIRKEIILTVGEKSVIRNAAETISTEFEFHKPRHGIAFTMDVANFISSRGCIYKKDRERVGVEKTMYNSIFTVVEKGKAEDVIEAAQKAGSKGGTIINARGSGIHETQKLFNMDIEPEKEIVLILSEESITDAIVKSISECLQIEDPGKGVLFVLDVSKTFGLY
ncbi:P-II family nitrogen regulator [Lachnoclostridium phytofermentans]|uniref:Nitrogen regulatory protein P-II n=1 Tax=Lachnoclostridium phytofermentans (strain ATCC 700394 / DSM 18823 / ISDg) TaxID=357809 RepID=A9KMW4_LACP7|nr:P-II family nitrogen regulator [Lachnoclostridium phytofermentans]ABX42975.1 nitrogen regulatory protein P-II [Lachnoclostridium phytofermentans ISDg]